MSTFEADDSDELVSQRCCLGFFSGCLVNWQGHCGTVGGMRRKIKEPVAFAYQVEACIVGKYMGDANEHRVVSSMAVWNMNVLSF